MLSYQHAYHAGGPADLHKHIALAELLARLTVKPRALSYMETHAGRALYDLGGPEAAKTGEAAAGIGQIAPDPATPFGHAIAAVRAEHGPAAYPGSPLVARALLRPQDRITLMELHPAEHAALRDAMGTGATVHRRDGFDAVLALCPPTPRRGLVLVDPSYEVKEEYAATARFVRALMLRWPEAVVMVWFPILPAWRHAALIEGLGPLSPLTDIAAITPRDARGMQGSGLALVNAPHGMAAVFRATRAQTNGILRDA